MGTSSAKSSSGCAALGLVGFLVLSVIGACLVVCVAAVIIIAVGASQQQDKALEANAGFGELDNPIPAGRAAVFENFSVIALQIIRPATEQVMTNNLNEAPAAGSDYVMIRFRVSCQKAGSEVCRGHEPKWWLVDSEGDEWGEPTLIFIEDNLDPKEAIGGSSIEGWQVFEFPHGEALRSLKISEPFGASLYALLPSQ